MSLHVDYRPKNFDSFYGNKIIIKNLIEAIKNKTLAHTILFHGAKGCGKTTLARIIKKELGCSNLGFFEFNNANTRGIDTARDIIDNIQFKAVDGSIKIFVLDEVHKTTNDFQNALLKVTEEPPSYVYFILCTTEPKKLLNTLYNRCVKFQVSELKNKEIEELLRNVIKKEKIKLNEDILEIIIDESEGNPRQALIMLNIVRYSNTTREASKLITEVTDLSKNTLDLCRALLKRDNWKMVASILKKLKEDPETVRYGILGYMSKVLLDKGIPQAAIVMECFEDTFFNSKKAGLILACYRVFH
jgi:DNA polymerase-3 subunit gamma/tau